MKKDRKSGTSDEDRALWQHVTKSVRAYDKGGKAAGDKGGKAAERGGRAAGEKRQPSAAQKPAAPVSAAKTRIIPAARSPLPDDGTARDLKKKKWPIDKTLDLHGMTQAAAHQALLRFVTLAVRQEKRTLLVITGKGSRLSGGGVLRRLLPLWLEEPPLRAHVLAFTPARTEDGGEGAFYLRLRKKKI